MKSVIIILIILAIIIIGIILLINNVFQNIITNSKISNTAITLRECNQIQIPTNNIIILLL